MSARNEGVTIRVNGERRPLVARRLSELLRDMGVDAAAAGIAVAINGEVVPRSAWSETLLSPDDAVEVVGAVQGG